MDQDTLPDPATFQNILEGISVSDQEIGNACRNQIEFLRINHLKALFELCAAAIQQPNATKTVLYNSLVVLNRALKPDYQISLTDVRKQWFSDDYQKAREYTKFSVVECVKSEWIEVRNQAALAISYLLIIELEKWSDLFPFFVNQLYSESCPGSAKSGIIATFTEVFQNGYVFNPNTKLEEIPKEFYGLGQFILVQLGSDIHDEQIHLQCLQCIYSMIDTIPQFFKEINFINQLLHTLELRFPSATERLYRRFHYLMFLIFKKFHDFDSSFMKIVFELTVKGFKSLYRSISMDFWGYIYLYEKKNLPSDGRPPFFNTLTAAQHLVPLLLGNIQDIIEPENDQYNDPDALDWNHFAVWTLKRFLKADIYVQTANSQKLNILPMIIQFLDFYMDQEDSMVVSLICLYGLQAICLNKKNHTEMLDSYLPKQFNYILYKCNHPTQRVSTVALMLLCSFIKTYNILASKNDFAQQIFHLVLGLIDREDLIINEQAVKLIATCASSFPIDTVPSFYGNYIEIFNKMNKSPFYIDSNLVSHPYKILYVLFTNIINHSESLKSSLPELNKCALSLLTLMLDQLRQSFGLMIQYQYQLSSAILRLITCLIKFLGESSSNFIENIIQTFVDIINHHDSLIEDALNVLAIIFSSCRNNFIRYQAPILDCLQRCISIPNPSIIGSTAFTIGLFFKFAKSMGYDYVVQPTQKLFNLLLDPYVDNRRSYYAQVVYSIALIIEGVGKLIPLNYRDEYLNKILTLSGAPFNPNNADEMEEIVLMFGSVSYGLKALITVFNDEEGFMQRFESQRKRNKIILYLIQIAKLKAYSEETMFNHFGLLLKFINITGSKFNVSLHNAYIKNFVQRGEESHDVNLKLIAKRISSELDRM
ncbi:hypothetical protein TRFO_17619 [Tritrichomonas foetus]|uniref:Importin N-terminal domain-containing protein n=1 Tax=Tritrichomonas foetus TaxID=1144522 RepID=A0A1J4KMM3_9EUKA|nr:hypothetical protein TRFO_17619 [Tritrichomonas foetus]|eukprot:OHT12475.1 hypothetical protein TRFO_17619 [Tritrichomonas foetus]